MKIKVSNSYCKGCLWLVEGCCVRLSDVLEELDLKKEVSNMNELIKKYKESLKIVRQLQLRANSEEDIRLLGSMASDLQYSLDWLKTGRRPGNRRGIERRAAYQRERPIDPIHVQNFVANPTKEKPCTVSDWDRQRIEDALSGLTDREREIYLMSRGQCLSYEQIAAYLFICKSTIQKTVERAENKITKRKQQSLFCFFR